MDAGYHKRFHEEVLADISKLEAKLEELRAVAKYHAEKADSRSSRPRIRRKKLAGDKVESSGRFATKRQVAAAAIVLGEADGPLRTAEVAKRMIDGGYKASNPQRLKMSLFTTMTRKTNVFRKTGPGLWTLAEEEDEND